MTAVNICREHDCACQEVAPSRRCGTCPERPREAAGTPDNSVLIRLRRPEGYEDVHPELLLADARIHPAFDAEIVAAAPPAAVPTTHPQGTDMTTINAAEVRQWADHPAGGGYVPVHPDTLRKIADELDNRREAYLNMRAWAEQNGLDTAAYNNGAPAAVPSAQMQQEPVGRIHHHVNHTPRVEWFCKVKRGDLLYVAAPEGDTNA